jgi:tRNA(Ile2) C34 agmatinyltransferase TiaS
MTQDEIKQQYEQHKDTIQDLRGEIEIEQARMRVLQRKCKHPNCYEYYAMGERGIKCPDCGYQT